MFIATDPQNHSGENTWFTPKTLVNALGMEFHTDPCTMSFRPYDIGSRVNIEHDLGEDGLSLDWRECGNMFINPPYGKELRPFVDKFILEKPAGMMLIFARMGSAPVQDLIQNYAYFFFLRKRIKFVDKNGRSDTNAGTDSMLVSWSPESLRRITLEGVSR